MKPFYFLKLIYKNYFFLMMLKFIPRQLFVLFLLQAFLFYMFVKGNKHLSGSYTGDEMLCLCVGYENSNL